MSKDEQGREGSISWKLAGMFQVGNFSISYTNPWEEACRATWANSYLYKEGSVPFSRGWVLFATN